MKDNNRKQQDKSSDSRGDFSGGIIKILKIFLTAALVVLILNRVGYRNIAHTFSAIGPLVFMVGAFFCVFALLTDVLIFRNLTFWAGGGKLKLLPVFLDYSRSTAFAAYTPASSGYLLMIKLLSGRGVETGTASAVLFIYKILNYTVILLLALFGVLLVLKETSYIWLTVFFILMLALLLAAALSEKARALIKKVAGEKIMGKFSGFSGALKKIVKNKKNIISLFILKLLNRVLAAVILFLVFYIHESGIALVDVLLLSSIAGVISTLPVTVGGFGLRGGSAVVLFSAIGAAGGVVVTAYLFFYVLKYAASALALILLTKKYGM